MPFWIEGWVEVCRSPDCGDDAWVSVINLGTLIDTADTVSEQLFGLSPAIINGSKHVDPIAANRGLPNHPSASVKQSLDGIRAHEANYGTGEFGGFTHATWEEIVNHNLRTADVLKSDWYVVFDLVRRLEQFVSADRIRFTVWFNW